MNLQSDDFTLLGLPRRFSQERALIDARWKDLQRQAHPDKFADQGAAAQRVAMQWSVRINEAHQRLKDPLRRAAYLCELSGHPVQAELNTAMPPAFLMQQMQWREELDDAASPQDLERIEREVHRARQGMLQELERLIDVQNDLAQAVQQVRALMFVQRFAVDVSARLDRALS